nr:methylmalonyl-CoA mutase, mitochondrial [Tanacetum cinerariifolium]
LKLAYKARRLNTRSYSASSARISSAALAITNIGPALIGQLLDELRQQRVVAGGEAAYAYHVHVVVYGLAGYLGGGLEERREVHVEAHVGEAGGDDFGAAVVAVLAHFGDEHARAAAFAGGKILGGLPGLGKVGVIGHALLSRIDAGQEVIVGVNKYLAPEGEAPLEVLQIDNDAVRESQVARLQKIRAERNETAVQAALAALTAAAKGKTEAAIEAFES